MDKNFEEFGKMDQFGQFIIETLKDAPLEMMKKLKNYKSFHK